MPRENSQNWSTSDVVTAERMNDINEDLDDLYSNGSDRLRVYAAVSWTPLRVDIGAGAYYIWSTSGVYAWWTDVAVTDNATNYIMIDNAWSITISTSARTAWLWRLAQVICSSGAITSIILRNNMVFGWTALDITALSEDTSPDEENDFLLSYDMSAAQNKKVKPKNLDIRPYIEWVAGETITAGQALRYANAAAGETNWPGVWTLNNMIFQFSTTLQAVWQSFTTVAWWMLSSIAVNLKKTGTPTWNITMDVYTNDNLVTPLYTSSTTVTAASLTTSYATSTFNFSNAYLAPATVYRFRLSSSWSNSASNYINCGDTTAWYAWWISYNIDSGNAWSTWSNDLWFTATIASTGETSGRLYKTSASFWYTVWFIWFARQSVSAAATVQVDTALTKNQSWLTPVVDYFLGNTAWSVSTTAWTVSKKIWKSLSATEIAIAYNPS